MAFTYEGEGAQLTRVDLRQTAGASSAACGEVGVSCATLRTTTTTYNPDGTPASTGATDDAGKRLVTCNYASGASPASGYDADKNPLATRTLATGNCADDTAASAISTTAMAYDSRGLLGSMTQGVRSPESSQMVSRSQSFAHRADATIATATHAGLTTAYTRSPAGWVESLFDWRPVTLSSTMAYSPAGSVTANIVGVANSVRSYKPDGSLASLEWGGVPGTNLRSHTNLAYDLGGLRTSETVSRPAPAGSLGTDPGGPAAYSYDLLGRLSSYTSPFKTPGETAEPTVAYSLDDGANAVSQTTTVAGVTRVAETSTYPAGRLATRRSVVTGSTTADTTFAYSALGEETTRSTAASPAVPTITTTYDAAGHVGSAEGVSYLYDGADHLLARTKGSETTLYFYWGPGTLLAEEADGTGTTVARYLADGAGGLIAQQTWRRVAGHKDPNDVTGTWAWLLDDPAGNVATHVNDAGAVLEQAAFDPYGAVEAGGSGQGPTAPGSSLGFQATLTDPSTGRVILGPRQYDPSTARFTNPDVFVGAAADIALGMDPLTGNRYLFAAANPVAYFEDGHCFAGKEASITRLSDQRRRSRLVRVSDSSRAGYHWTSVSYTEDVYSSESVCVRGGALGELVDYGLGNDITRGVIDAGYSNRFRNGEQAVAENAPRYARACISSAASGFVIGAPLGPWSAAGQGLAGCATGVGRAALLDLGADPTVVAWADRALNTYSAYRNYRRLQSAAREGGRTIVETARSAWRR